MKKTEANVPLNLCPREAFVNGKSAQVSLTPKTMLYGHYMTQQKHIMMYKVLSPCLTHFTLLR